MHRHDFDDKDGQDTALKCSGNVSALYLPPEIVKVTLWKKNAYKFMLKRKRGTDSFFHPLKSDLILWPPFLWTDRATTSIRDIVGKDVVWFFRSPQHLCILRTSPKISMEAKKGKEKKSEFSREKKVAVTRFSFWKIDWRFNSRHEIEDIYLFPSPHSTAIVIKAFFVCGRNKISGAALEVWQKKEERLK